MKKRILTSTLSVILCFAICIVTTASTPVTATTAFIDEELTVIMETAATNELIPVDIWITELDTEAVENEVMATVGLNEVSILSANSTTSATSAQLDAYIETEREVYAEMQSEQSHAFLSKYNGIFNSRSSSEEKLTYVSKYAPVISAKLTVEEINRLAKDLTVKAIYYIPDTIDENCSNVSVPLVGANYVRDTLSYSGSGIKIGMIELAMPNPNAGYFTSSNIICDPTATQSTNADYQAHANLVASIMVAKSTTVNGVTYKGIVPNAQLYATCYDGSADDNKEHIEWLLTQGVNVINMSAGASGTGNYTARELWMDHIAINHSVHFVITSGNTSGNINSPAMAYNVITVGNLNDKNTSSSGDDEIWSTSSYIEVDGYANKPDLVAPGTEIATAAGTNTGTSFSAPHVAAIVAQLCQAYPTLKTKQDAMKAILMASINHSVHAYTPYDDAFDKYGAGMINARQAMYTASNSRYVSSDFAANAEVGSTKTYTFNVTSSDNRIRVALATLKYAKFSSTQTHATSTPSTVGTVGNVCLWVYNPDGSMAAGSGITYGNTQVVDFEPKQTGTYTIEVEVWEESDQKTYFGLAWW